MATRFWESLGFTLAIAFSSIASANPAWPPDLSTPEGQLDFEISVLFRHPQLLQQTMKFNRSIPDVFADFNELREKLGPNLADQFPSSISIATSHYSAQSELTFPEKQLKDVMEDLEKATDVIKNTGKILRNIQEDAVQFASDPKLFKKWLKLAPLLYDPEGNPRSEEKISQLKAEPMNLQRAYLEFFNTQKSKLLQKFKEAKLGQAPAALQSLENQFVRRELVPATTPTSAAEMRAIQMEEWIPGMGKLRGSMIGDCATLTGANYAMLKKSKIFAVRVSRSSKFDGQPDGYSFVVLGKVDGKEIPYVITNSGPYLKTEDGQLMLWMVSKIFRTEQIVIADVISHPHLVNEKPMWLSMQVPNARPVKVELPEGWDVVDGWKIKDGINGYTRAQVQEGMLIDVKDLPIQTPVNIETRAPDYDWQSVETFSVLQRALFASQFIAVHPETREMVRKRLNVNDAEIKAADAILRNDPDKPFTAEEYKNAEQLLAFKMENLTLMPLPYLASSLTQLKTDKPQLFSEDQWKDLTEKTRDRLKKQIEKDRSHHHDWTIPALQKAIVSLPEVTDEDLKSALSNADPKVVAAAQAYIMRTGISNLGMQELGADCRGVIVKEESQSHQSVHTSE